MTAREEIQQHLIALNWAYVEQEKYHVDAYDQRNGQRWFFEAMERVNAELMWFMQHRLLLEVSLQGGFSCIER